MCYVLPSSAENLTYIILLACFIDFAFFEIFKHQKEKIFRSVHVRYSSRTVIFFFECTFEQFKQCSF